MELLNKKEYAIPIFILFVFFMFYKPVICFLILGLLTTIIGIKYWIFIVDIQKNGIESIGKILFYESDEDGYKTPTIEFKTKNGIQINKKPYYYSSTDLSKIKTYKNKINESVSVLYDKKNPKKFVLENERNFNYFSLILITLAGIVFLTAGILSLLEIIIIDF
ncbi:DUF3592 domain-containing protein [Xanthomarina sp. F1114]|uniref:DUF3592 domain-containing protein n=1 Tax=Xanthomarina sp. F1114 TaxID=2996019 RepID=UPI00225E0D5E|nr:DUF3592 domain-containing protein [Xanthomarina sp. F1114]MCX7549179.1 DUF3592 domain-containing protein [Xanthomarina sp. F1114]